MLVRAITLSALLITALGAVEGDYTAENPLIDMQAFIANAQSASVIRIRSRLSEERFMELAAKPGVIVLDARSADKYAMLHIKGAINLPFSDISVPSLAKLLPDKNQMILIYCNNNFAGAPVAMASKSMSASLNLATYTVLHGYGYTNLGELGPLLDVKTTKIPLVGEVR